MSSNQTFNSERDDLDDLVENNNLSNVLVCPDLFIRSLSD